ncbi:hypothetical protein SLA2020_212220 [Shorea laevis]
MLWLILPGSSTRANFQSSSTVANVFDSTPTTGAIVDAVILKVVVVAINFVSEVARNTPITSEVILRMREALKVVPRGIPGVTFEFRNS